MQPRFLPWRGHLDLISRGDVVVFFDTVQYVRGGWDNRNRIITPEGPKWITIPVKKKGCFKSLIKDVRIDNNLPWQRKITGTVHYAYHKHPYFDCYYSEFASLINKPRTFLSDLNTDAISWAFKCLGKTINFCMASDLDVNSDDPLERVVLVCKAVGAIKYISGRAAQTYIRDKSSFEREGIELEWMDYDYPEYPQYLLYTDSPLSIIDLLFNVGDDASSFIWSKNGV